METIVDPIDEQLNRFERDIRQLKIEYEQYFGGGRKRPPAEIEWRLDTVLKRYGDRGAAMNYAQRFKFGNLSETYARYRDVLHKRLRKREEGTIEGITAPPPARCKPNKPVPAARNRRRSRSPAPIPRARQNPAQKISSSCTSNSALRLRVPVSPLRAFPASSLSNSCSRKPSNSAGQPAAKLSNSSSAWKAAKVRLKARVTS